MARQCLEVDDLSTGYGETPQYFGFCRASVAVQQYQLACDGGFNSFVDQPAPRLVASGNNAHSPTYLRKNRSKRAGALPPCPKNK